MIPVDRFGVRARYIWESCFMAAHAAGCADAAVEAFKIDGWNAKALAPRYRAGIEPVYWACNSSSSACVVLVPRLRLLRVCASQNKRLC